MKNNARNSGKRKSIRRIVFRNLDWNFPRAALSLRTVHSTTSYVWTKSEPTDCTFVQTFWNQLNWTRTSWNEALRMMGRGYTGTRFWSEVSLFTTKVEIILKLGGAKQIWRIIFVSFVCRGFMHYMFFEEVRGWTKSTWPNFTFYIARATNQQINITVQQVGIDSL
jgi:hypothetical protein